MLISIIAFLIMFSVIVIGHEFGHFSIARRNGIRVKEFAMGMGPELFSVQKGETVFTLRALPIGGACVFDGMDILMDGGTLDDLDDHAYPKASVFARIATVLGGPMMNFILGFIFALIIVSFCGSDLPVVTGVLENSAAQEVGLQEGDTIKKINGERIHLYRDVQLVSMMNYGEQLDIVVDRGGEKKEFILNPKYNEEQGRYYIGIMGGNQYIYPKGLQTFEYALYEAQYWVRSTIKSLALIFNGRFTPDDLSGPVGIVQVVDTTYTSSKQYGIASVLLSFLNLATLLSINLGIMNLLPIPALDGGRLLILIVEAVTGKRLSAKAEGTVTAAGVVFLLLIMVFVLFNDITKFFR